MTTREVPRHWLSEGAECLVAQLDKPGGASADVVIVGSGYGAAVAAARFGGLMRRDGCALKIVVLERGDEYLPGAFPDRFAQLLPHLRSDRWTTAEGPTIDEIRTGLDSALFDLKLGPEVSALVANGLGGGSLINANVVERPQAEVLTQAAWPRAIRDALQPDPHALDTHFDAVEQMLGAQPFTHQPPKTEALFDDIEALKKEIGAGNVRTVLPKLAVTQIDGMNVQDVMQHACIGCGNCVSGCNYGAKNTLPMNYLALARRRGVRLYTGATVVGVRPKEPSKADTAWTVSFSLTHDRRERALDDARFEITARHVVLAAGAFGTPQILHQSLSATGGEALAHLDPERGGLLGAGFSCNGDGIAAAYDQTGRTTPVGGVGADPTVDLQRPGNVGPTITGMLDLRRRSRLADRFVIQDAAIPFALRRLYEEMLTSFGMVHAMTRWNERASVGAPDDDALAVSSQRVDRSQFFLIVGHDDAGWRLRFKKSATGVGAAVHKQFLSVVSVGKRKAGPPAEDFEPVRERQRAVDALLALLVQGRTGGLHIPNPMWQPAPGALLEALRPDDPTAAPGADPLGAERLLTVHPLGGCRMADGGADGVVNHLGQVFMAGGGTEVFDTLVVMDGSIVPTSLGINPLLTIAALAERACAALAVQWGWVASNRAPLRLPEQPAIVQPMAWTPTPTAVAFTETMKGGLQLTVNKNADLAGLDAAQQSRLLDAFAKLKVAFTIDDLWALSRNPHHAVAASAELTLRWPGDRRATKTPTEMGEGLPGAKTFAISLLSLLPSTRNERIWRALNHWLETRGEAFIHAAFDRRWKRQLALRSIRAGLRVSGSCTRNALIRALELWVSSGFFAGRAKRVLGMVQTASHHGEARAMTYELGSLSSADTPFSTDVRVLAAKRIHYGWSAGYRQRPSKGVPDAKLPSPVPSNPWRGMVALDVLMVSRSEGRPLTAADWPLDQRPAWLLQGSWRVVGVGSWWLQLDELVTRQVPQLLRYQSLPDAWLDLASFGAFVARCLAQSYFWRWRLPAYATALPQPAAPTQAEAPAGGEKSVGPLPGHVLAADKTRYDEAPGRGQSWQWHPLTVGSAERPAKIVLTNFKPELAAPHRNHPVLMIHGFVTSGYQFATPCIKTNAVQWLTRKGFDVWVLDLRTSVAVQSSHQAWDFDALARDSIDPKTGKPQIADLPAAFRHVMQEAGASQLHAVVHCMGSAVFNMAVLSGALTDPKTGRTWVRSAVQAQVSMDVVSSPPNRLKASGVRFLEDVLDVGELSVVADKGALTAERMGETLMDRFLMTWPTNDVDALQQADNALDAPRQSFVATVNRINAMYGRNFSYDNLGPDVLDQLHELFRHANVRTMRHVLQFHRAGRVVDFEGRDTYVSDANIRQHYGFPVRFLHSQFGAVFVPASTRRSKIRLDRLCPALTHDRIVLRAPRDEERRPKHRQWGHFDIWLSERSATEVFPKISEFLIEHDHEALPMPVPVAMPAALPAAPIRPCSAQNPVRPCFSYQLPDLGPWLGWWRAANEAPKPDGIARLWFRSPFRDATGVQAAVFALQPLPFPALLGLTTICDWADIVLRLGCAALDVTVPIKFADHALIVVCRSTQTTWFEEPDPSVRADNGARLWVFDPDDLTLTSAPIPERSDSRVGTLMREEVEWHLAGFAATDSLALGSMSALAPTPELGATTSSLAGPQPFLRLESTLFRQLAPAERMTFLLASCRYQATDMEAQAADTSLTRAVEATKAEFALLVGDQIYADASYGVLDGRPSSARLRSKYTALWSGAAGALGRRMPLYLCGDDHELRDGWFADARSTAQQRESDRLALDAMDAYQYAAMPMANPAAAAMPHRDYAFSAAGFEFYVLDTRFERGAPGTHIWSAEQYTRFWRWLHEQKPKGSRPIFIVSPTPVYPFDVQAGRTEDQRRGDGWQSYPQSLTQMFDALLDAGCARAVFLSGDRHISHCATGNVLRNDGRQISLDSIVSSGLNSPMPFANDQPGDILTSFHGPISPHCTLNYKVVTESQSAGWAEVRVAADAGGAWLVNAVFR